MSETTTATGCSLGVRHPFSGKLVAQKWRIASTSKRLLDRISLSCQGGHQHHETVNCYHTLGIPFPDALARRVCRVLMETTSGEEVFSFIAAAAAGTGNDDLQMEDWDQDIKEPATKKQRNLPESHRTEAEVSKKELELLTRHLQSIHSSCGHCSNETLSERYVGREPNHSSSNLHVILSVHHVKKYKINVLIQSQAWKPFLPSGKAFRLIKQSGVTPQTTLNTSFSVIIDEGCHLKVAKMLFPMTNNDLHQNPVWTELRDFYLEQWVCCFGRPKRVRVDSEGSWMSEAAAEFFGKESVMLEPIPGQAHWQTGLVEEAIRGLTATMTATALEHPDMGAHECLARAVAASNAREDVRGYSPLQHALGRAPDLDGRFYTPE